MQLIFIIFFFFIAIFSGYFISNYSPNLILVFILSIVFFIFSFFSTKISFILLIFSMLLSPEISMGVIGNNKQVVVRYDDILLIIIFFSWFIRNAIYKKEFIINKDPVSKPLIFYTLIYVLSTSFGILREELNYQKASFYLLKYIEYYILFFMTMNILRYEKDIKKYLKYAYLVLIITITYSYYYYNNAQGKDIRTSAPFEAPLDSPKESEPASLGGYYLLAFSIFLVSLSELSGLNFLFSTLTIIYLYPSFLLTFSRASYIGFIAILISLIVFVKKRKVLFLSLLLFGIIFGLSVPGISNKVKNRIESTYTGDEANKTIRTSFGEVKLEESAYLRYESLRNVIINVFPKYPLLGKGVTGIGLGDNQYALILGETGILGLIVFFWLIYSIMKMSYFIYINSLDKEMKILGLAIFLVTIGFLFQGIGVNTFIIVRIMEPFWFLIAILSIEYQKIILKENEAK